MAINDAEIRRCVAVLLDLISESTSPKEAEHMVMHAVHTWGQAHVHPTPWRFYDVDGYQFVIRLNENGRLVIGREL